jgi:hypothetical protein
MKIVTLPLPPAKPAADLIAEELLAGLNAELARRIENHAAAHARFWDSAETPDAICEALGENGKLFLDLSRENLRNIGAIAAMVGKTLDDAIAPANYMPRREILEAGNRIHLATPAPGQDAWGRVLTVQPSPEEE